MISKIKEGFKNLVSRNRRWREIHIPPNALREMYTTFHGKNKRLAAARITRVVEDIEKGRCVFVYTVSNPHEPIIVPAQWARKYKPQPGWYVVLNEELHFSTVPLTTFLMNFRKISKRGEP